MRVNAYEIAWDTDGRKARGLPSEAVVQIPNEHPIDYSFDGPVDRARDRATDSTGWRDGAQ
jgi:hypothetical protein